MAMNLDGRQLRYLIGGSDGWPGRSDEVTELSYDAQRLPLQGIGIKYGNLFNEKYGEQSAKQREVYAPYLPDTDTSAEYDEGRIDPAGKGWARNLDEQFGRAKAQGFGVLELDNPDAYNMTDVLGAVDRCQAAGLLTVAKNPLICRGDRVAYVAHPAVIGAIVERDCGTPNAMDQLRMQAGKPTLPVWFVSFAAAGPIAKQWAERMAREIADHDLRNMGVTWDPTSEEYAASSTVYAPVAPEPAPQPPAEIPMVRLRVDSDAPLTLVLSASANVTIDVHTDSED